MGCCSCSGHGEKKECKSDKLDPELIEKYPQGSREREVLEYSYDPSHEVPGALRVGFKFLLGVTVVALGLAAMELLKRA